MKKNEYVSPEMEIVEIETQALMQAVSMGGDTPDFKDPEDPDPGLGDDGWV